MALLIIPPNVPRPGVFAGFALDYPAAPGFVPLCSPGALWANGSLYLTTVAPTLPAAPASQHSWLFYNFTTGWYWGSTTSPATAGDAGPVAWAVTDGTTILVLEQQTLLIPDSSDGGGSGIPASGVGSGAPTVVLPTWPMIELPNDPSVGTTIKRTAILTGSGQVKIAPAGTTGGIVGLVERNAGTVGAAGLAPAGPPVLVDFDGATTANDYVVASLTDAGKVHSAGATFPVGTQVLGRVLSTNAAAGTYFMLPFGPEIQASTGGGGGGGGLSAAPPYLSDGSGNYYIMTPTLVKVTLPSLTTFSWANQGSATVATGSNGHMELTDPAGDTQLRVRKISAPPTPWTLTAIVQNDPFDNGGDFATNGIRSGGICLIDGASSGPDIAYIGTIFGNVVIGHHVSGYDLSAYNSIFPPTDQFGGFASGSGGIDATVLVGTLLAFYRITDNGTNIIVEFSANGQPSTFTTIATFAKGLYFPTSGGPTELGFYATSASGYSPANIAITTLLSWGM